MYYRQYARYLSYLIVSSHDLQIAVKKKPLNNVDAGPQVHTGSQPSWLNFDVRFTPVEVSFLATAAIID